MSPTFCISRSPRPSGRSPTTHEIIPHHAQIHEPFLRWTKLPQFYACFQEDLRSFGVHVVTLTIYHLRNSHLHNLDGTCQAGARVAVKYTPVTHSLPSCFQQSILLGMNAQTRAQICSTRSPLSRSRTITSGTPAFSAVLDISGCAIIPRSQDSSIAN